MDQGGLGFGWLETGRLVYGLMWSLGILAVAASSARIAVRSCRRQPAEYVWLTAGLWFFLCTTLPVAILGFSGLLQPVLLLGLAAGGGLWALRDGRGRPFANLPRWAVPRQWRLPLWLTGGLFLIDLSVLLPMPPTAWDAMTYHLFLPARWLQDGRIFHIPTVFGDNAAAFAPQNGALIFAWHLGLSGNDAVINVLQGACLPLTALALYAVARNLELGPAASGSAALLLFWLGPIRQWAWTANVDIFLLTFWAMSLAWTLRYRRSAHLADVASAGLAAGLAAGTKTLAAPLIALTALLLLPTWWRRRGDADEIPIDKVWVHMLTWGSCLLVAGGWWWLRNLWLYGNPLFPLDLRLGPLKWAGAYDRAALEAGEFHLDGLGATLGSLVQDWGLLTVLLVIGGGVLLGRWSGRHGLAASSRSTARQLAGLAAAWTCFFLFSVPHNNQTRFLLPTLFLGIVGLACALHRASLQGEIRLAGAWLACLGLAVWTAPVGRLWQRPRLAFADAAEPLSPWILGGVATAILVGLALGVLRRTGPRSLRALPLMVAVVGTAFFVGMAGATADRLRPFALQAADFKDWSPGFLLFHDPLTPDSRIAYTGTNVPYALMGAGQRHRVSYVNVQGEAADGFYEFWRRNPRTYEYHKPGIYRGQENEALWLQRLQEEEIDMVVIFALHWAEHRYIRSTAGGFPLEQTWASRHPERLQPVFRHPAAQIYRVRRGAMVGPDSDPR